MSRKFKSFSDLQDAVATDKEIQEKLRADPSRAIQELEVRAPVYTRDRVIYRMVVGVMGMVILMSLGAVVWITVVGGEGEVDNRIPAVLTATCSAALGALAGLLVPAPQQQ